MIVNSLGQFPIQLLSNLSIYVKIRGGINLKCDLKCKPFLLFQKNQKFKTQKIINVYQKKVFWSIFCSSSLLPFKFFCWQPLILPQCQVQKRTFYDFFLFFSYKNATYLFIKLQNILFQYYRPLSVNLLCMFLHESRDKTKIQFGKQNTLK